MYQTATYHGIKIKTPLKKNEILEHKSEKVPKITPPPQIYIYNYLPGLWPDKILY